MGFIVPWSAEFRVAGAAISHHMDLSLVISHYSVVCFPFLVVVVRQFRVKAQKVRKKKRLNCKTAVFSYPKKGVGFIPGIVIYLASIVTTATLYWTPKFGVNERFYRLKVVLRRI